MNASFCSLEFVTGDGRHLQHFYNIVSPVDRCVRFHKPSGKLLLVKVRLRGLHALPGTSLPRCTTMLLALLIVIGVHRETNADILTGIHPGQLRQQPHPCHTSSRGVGTPPSTTVYKVYHTVPCRTRTSRGDLYFIDPIYNNSTVVVLVQVSDCQVCV